MPSRPTTGNISFFTACDAGKCRVPSPAMGMTALRMAATLRDEIIRIETKHPTSNIQDRTTNAGRPTARLQMDVGCWLLDVGCSFLFSDHTLNRCQPRAPKV